MLVEIKKTFRNFKVNSSRVYIENLLIEATKFLPPTAIVLDAGAGQCPYKSLFSHVKYESTDFCQVNKEYGEIDYICDLTSIPVEDNKYDMVICNQVLEHVPEPEAVLRELHRVLKHDGQLWLSAPLFYEEHEMPHDYYRYTQFAFNYLFQKVGLKIKKIEWVEGYYGTLSYQLEGAAKSLPLNPKFYGGGLLGFVVTTTVLLIKPLFAVLSLLFARLDMRYKNVSSGYCKNYAIIAEKANFDS
jgi:SAM-dependent methyltransferase